MLLWVGMPLAKKAVKFWGISQSRIKDFSFALNEWRKVHAESAYLLRNTVLRILVSQRKWDANNAGIIYTAVSWADMRVSGWWNFDHLHYASHVHLRLTLPWQALNWTHHWLSMFFHRIENPHRTNALGSIQTRKLSFPTRARKTWVVVRRIWGQRLRGKVFFFGTQTLEDLVWSRYQNFTCRFPAVTKYELSSEKDTAVTLLDTLLEATTTFFWKDKWVGQRGRERDKGTN